MGLKEGVDVRSELADPQTRTSFRIDLDLLPLLTQQHSSHVGLSLLALVAFGSI